MLGVRGGEWGLRGCGAEVIGRDFYAFVFLVAFMVSGQESEVQMVPYTSWWELSIEVL